MGFFNKAQLEGMRTGRYICSECGALMEFEDEWEDILVCLQCGHSVDLERYGFENDEEYEALYPSKEEVCGYEDEEADGDKDAYDDAGEYDVEYDGRYNDD